MHQLRIGRVGRPFLLVFLMVALLASAIGTSFGAERRIRKASRRYVGGSVAVGDSGIFFYRVDPGNCDGSPGIACVRFPTRPRESRVRVSVRDASNSGRVPMWIGQDYDGDGDFDSLVEPRCGNSGWMSLSRPGANVLVVLDEGHVGLGSYGFYIRIPGPAVYRRCWRIDEPAMVTTGTVTAEFSR